MKLTVYIHPDRGPVSPVELDLYALFGTVTLPSNEELGPVHLRKLYEAIRARFPKVRPESNEDGLKRIYANFRHADRFDGAVLRVTGEIDAPPSVLLQQCVEEVRLREVELRKLGGELKVREGLLSQLNERVQQIQAELDRLGEAPRKLDAARKDLNRARNDLYQATTRAKQLEDTVRARDLTIEELQAELRRPPPGPPL